MSEIDNDRDTLFKLKNMVEQLVGGKSVIKYAEKWSDNQGKSWPSGTYCGNDIGLFFEVGFYRGYLKGSADRAEKDFEICNVLTNRIDSLRSVIEALLENAECRGDEDCDHCHALRTLEELMAAPTLFIRG